MLELAEFGIETVDSPTLNTVFTKFVEGLKKEEVGVVFYPDIDGYYPDVHGAIINGLYEVGWYARVEDKRIRLTLSNRVMDRIKSSPGLLDEGETSKVLRAATHAVRIHFGLRRTAVI